MTPILYTLLSDTVLWCKQTMKHMVSQLVFWAQSTTKDYIRAKNNVQSVSYFYPARKPSNHKSKNNKISTATNVQKTYTNIKQNFFEELVPSVLPLLKKHVRLGHTGIVDQLVNWYFELSQPQRITSQLKTMFNLSPIYSACKSSNHKLFKNHKISPVHKFTQNKTNSDTQTSHTKFLKNYCLWYHPC